VRSVDKFDLCGVKPSDIDAPSFCAFCKCCFSVWGVHTDAVEHAVFFSSPVFLFASVEDEPEFVLDCHGVRISSSQSSGLSFVLE